MLLFTEQVKQYFESPEIYPVPLTHRELSEIFSDTPMAASAKVVFGLKAEDVFQLVTTTPESIKPVTDISVFTHKVCSLVSTPLKVITSDEVQPFELAALVQMPFNIAIVTPLPAGRGQPPSTAGMDIFFPVHAGHWGALRVLSTRAYMWCARLKKARLGTS